MIPGFSEISDRPRFAYQIVVGDLLVYNNQIYEVGRIRRPARFLEKGVDGMPDIPAQTPVFELWPPGEVEGEPHAVYLTTCIDEEIRATRPHRAAQSRRPDTTRWRKMCRAVLYGDLCARQYARGVLQNEINAEDILALLDRLETAERAEAEGRLALHPDRSSVRGPNGSSLWVPRDVYEDECRRSNELLERVRGNAL